MVQVGPDAFLRSLQAKRLADVDEWQTEMQLKPMRLGRVQLFTRGLNEADRRITGVELAESVEQAVEDCMSRSGDDAVAVIPEGPYVVPLSAC